MEEVDPVNMVFSLEELVIIILEFATSSQSQNEICKLREVCHLWKKVIFNILIKKGHLFRLQIGSTKFAKTLSPTCYIPMTIDNWDRKWTIEHFAYLDTYSENLVHLKFTFMPSCDLGHLRIPYKLNFPQLRYLELLPPCRDVYYRKEDKQNADYLVGQILAGAPRLKVFKLWIHYPAEPCNKETQHLPEQITSIHIKTDENWPPFLFTSILDANLPKLNDLHWEVGDASDDAGISQIINKFSNQLVKLELQSKKGVVISINKMEKLQLLALSNVLLQTSSAKKSLVGYLPVLRKLRISSGVPHRMAYVVNNFRPPNGQIYERLRDLALDAHRLEGEVAPEDVDIMTSLLKAVPNLSTLMTDYLSTRMAYAIMPVICNGLQKMTSLALLIRLLDAGYEDEPLDDTLLITGVEDSNVPKDTTTWNRSLGVSENCITKLKELESFDLHSSNSFTCQLSHFTFAAFHETPKLRNLEFGGSIEVDEECKESWENAGGEIETGGSYKSPESPGELVPREDNYESSSSEDNRVAHGSEDED